jgi:thiopurine S-methyltransferase
MEAEFWHQAWQEGRIGFHRGEPHPALIEHFPLLEAKVEQSILVPLCGKSHDLTWLTNQGLYVRGIEISEQAVLEYFTDNNIITPQKTANCYTHQGLTLEVNDFLEHQNTVGYDFIYDRAAIVALPPEMRVKYAKKWLELLNPGGKAILISFEYDQSKVAGPPFSVEEEEIIKLFSHEASIKVLEEKSEKPNNPKFADADVKKFTWKVYLIEKKS